MTPFRTTGTLIVNINRGIFALLVMRFAWKAGPVIARGHPGRARLEGGLAEPGRLLALNRDSAIAKSTAKFGGGWGLTGAKTLFILITC